MDTIKYGMRRYRDGDTKLWANSPDIKLGRKSLIDFDSINWTNISPFNTQDAPEIPVKEELMELIREELAEAKEKSAAQLYQSLPNTWVDFYNPLDKKYYQDKHNVNSGRAKGQDRAKDMAVCMAIVRMLNEYSTASQIKAATGYKSKGDLQKAIFRYIKENNIYGLPGSYRNFLPKFQRFKELLADPEADSRDCLLNGNSGNKAAEKFDWFHRQIFLQVYLNPKNKPDKLECWYNYLENMKVEFGLAEESCIGYRRFKQICNEKEIKVLAARCRNGSSYYEVFVRPWVIRKAPKYAMSLVAGDGWVPGRSVRYKKIKIDEQGKKKVTIKVGGMSVWIWYDWKSSAILSHRISPDECSEDIRKSFRNLIAYHGGCPLSVMIDKKWMNQKETKEMFELADVFMQPKRAYNPKSNIAERNNRVVNKHHRNIDQFWVDITNNTEEFKHNDEHVRGADPLEEAEFRSMILKIIERHNHTPRKSLEGLTPWEVFESNKNPEVRTFSPLDMTYIFGGMSRPTEVRNYGVKFEIASRKYYYLIPEDKMLYYNSLNVHRDKVIVYYDELHMNTVDIYSFDPKDKDNKSKHRFICTCYDADEVAINAALVEEPLDERFAKQQRRGKLLDKWIEETMNENEEALAEMDMSPAGIQQVSQARYKEIHSNRIAQAYGNFHKERDEDEGHKVNDYEDRPARNRSTSSSKMKLLDEKLKNFKGE